MDLDPPLRIGTRASAIAIQQATMVAQSLQRKGLTQGYAVVPVGELTGGGDPSSFAGGGLQTAVLREALAQGECDVAVHFAKDIPPASPLELGAVLPRRDPREALCSRGQLKLADLPAGARVGVPVGVRSVQLKALRDDLTLVKTRGPVETRLDLVLNGSLDAVVLAHAVVSQEFEHWVGELFPLSAMIPTPAQGITVVELGPTVDERTRQLVASLTDRDSWIRLVAERRFQALMSQSTAAPVGAVSEIVTESGLSRLRLRVVVAGVDEVVRGEMAVDLGEDGLADSSHLGEALARRLSFRAAGLKTGAVAGANHGPRVMYDSSSVGQAYRSQILAQGGIPVPVPLATTRIASDETLDTVMEQMTSSDRVGIASPMVVEIFADYARRRGTSLDEMLAAVTVGAIGAPVASALAEEYVNFEVIPTVTISAEALAPVWPAVEDGSQPVTVLPGSNNSSPVLAKELRGLGWDVRQPVVYTRTPAMCGPEQQAAMDEGWPDVVILSSRTSVKGFEALYGLPPDNIRVVVVGRYAGQDAADLGMRVDVLVAASRVEDVVKAALARR